MPRLTLLQTDRGGRSRTPTGSRSRVSPALLAPWRGWAEAVAQRGRYAVRASEILFDRDGLSAEGAGSRLRAVRGAGHRRVLGGDDGVRGDGAARDDARAAGADDGARGPDAQGGDRIGTDPGEQRRDGTGRGARGQRQRCRGEDGDGRGEDLRGDGDPHGAGVVVQCGLRRADGRGRHGRRLDGAGHRDGLGGDDGLRGGGAARADDARAADGDGGGRDAEGGRRVEPLSALSSGAASAAVPLDVAQTRCRWR